MAEKKKTTAKKPAIKKKSIETAMPGNGHKLQKGKKKTSKA